MQIYRGRNRNVAPAIKLSENVVLSLTEGLNRRNVTCDNFFTSHSLATELKKRQMTIVGTMRKNRKEIPSVLVNMKSKPAQYSEFVFDHTLRATMVSYVPKKYKSVTLLSTYHTSKKIDIADKKKPEIIQFYNSTKGAVDTLDEMVGTYRCKRRVLRWPLVIFENMLDISACNALILFLAVNPQWKFAQKKYRRRLFLVELGTSLTTPYAVERKTLPRGKRARDVVLGMKQIPQEPPAKKRRNVPAESIDTSRLSHLIHHPPPKKRARCYLCPYASNANVHAAMCDKCKKHICPNHRFIVCDRCCGVEAG